MGNLKIKKRILVIVAMLALLLSGIAGISNTHSSTEAFSFCKNVGSSLGQKSSGGMFQGAANPDVDGREWTAEEIFRGSLSYSTYYGEGPGTWLYAEKLDRASTSAVGDHESVAGKLDEARGFGCIMNLNWVPNMIIGMSSLLTGIVGSVIMMLVGRDFMAETLTTIVGGSGGGDDGLIGTFMSSFYMPLILIAVIIMVVTIIYKGLIQMKMREALSSLIWSLGAFIVGVALMLSPQMLAGMPQAATSTITTCVLGALSGQNCLSGDVETPSMLAGRECMSSVTDGNDSESVVNSLNCTIWKTFTLEPWAENQFGEPYNDLYTKNAPDGGDIWSNLPEGEEDLYCVNFASNESYDTSMKGTPNMDLPASAEVCNVALYHLFIKTNMKDPVSNDENNTADRLVTDDTGEFDSRWYDIIIPMAGDDSRWKNWIGEDQFGSRLGTSLMGLIAIIASSTVLLTLGLFAGAYKITGLILMAFAPVFFLLAVEPTRGKRIFLGWLESLVSSILKYFAITVLIIVALIMYAGLLSNTSGVTSLVGIIVLTIALHMYRKEIVDLIGAANMGGERLSNKANDFGSWAGKQAKEKTSAAVGGAIGGALGSRKARKETHKARNETIKGLQDKLSSATTEEERDFYEQEIGKEKEAKFQESGSVFQAIKPWKNKDENKGSRRDNLKGALRGQFNQIKGGLGGSSESVKRSMKRGTGTSANIFQQMDRTKLDMKRQVEDQSSAANKLREKFEADRIAKQATGESVPDNTQPTQPTQPVQTTSQPNESKVEEQQNVEVEYEKARKSNGEIQYKGELSPEELEELDKFAKSIGNDQSDQELIDMIRSEEVSSDRNKEAIVAREISARLDANFNMSTTSTILEGANPVERGEMSREEYMINQIEGSYSSTNFNSKGEADEMLKQYNKALMDNGLTSEQAEGQTEALMKQRESVLQARQSEYKKAVEYVIDTQAASVSTLQRKFGMGYKEAVSMIDTMEKDGIVSAYDSEAHNRHVKAKSMDEVTLSENKFIEELESSSENKNDGESKGSEGNNRETSQNEEVVSERTPKPNERSQGETESNQTETTGQTESTEQPQNKVEDKYEPGDNRQPRQPGQTEANQQERTEEPNPVEQRQGEQQREEPPKPTESREQNAQQTQQQREEPPKPTESREQNAQQTQQQREEPPKPTESREQNAQQGQQQREEPPKPTESREQNAQQGQQQREEPPKPTESREQNAQQGQQQKEEPPRPTESREQNTQQTQQQKEEPPRPQEKRPPSNEQYERSSERTQESTQQSTSREQDRSEPIEQRKSNDRQPNLPRFEEDDDGLVGNKRHQRSEKSNSSRFDNLDIDDSDSQLNEMLDEFLNEEVED